MRVVVRLSFSRLPFFGPSGWSSLATQLNTPPFFFWSVAGSTDSLNSYKQDFGVYLKTWVRPVSLLDCFGSSPSWEPSMKLQPAGLR
jgi:hypothetical protein